MGGSSAASWRRWAITRTDRFACAVAGAPVTWLEGMAWTSDIGPTWSVAERRRARDATAPERSLTGAARIRTPLLLYHGEADLRVPIAQSEALLAAITLGGRGGGAAARARRGPRAAGRCVAGPCAPRARGHPGVPGAPPAADGALIAPAARDRHTAGVSFESGLLLLAVAGIPRVRGAGHHRRRERDRVQRAVQPDASRSGWRAA